MTLTEARRHRNLTQVELASICDVTNITMSYIEGGKHFASRETRKRIEEVLGLQVDWLSTRFPDSQFQEVDDSDLDIIIAISGYVFDNRSIDPVSKCIFLLRAIESLKKTLVLEDSVLT